MMETAGSVSGDGGTWTLVLKSA